MLAFYQILCKFVIGACCYSFGWEEQKWAAAQIDSHPGYYSFVWLHTHTHSRSHLCGMATINGLHLFLLWLYVHGIWMWACVCVRVSCPTIEIIPFEHGIFLLIFLLSFASYILKRTLRERIDFLHLNFFSLVLAEIHSPSCIHTHIQMHPIP